MRSRMVARLIVVCTIVALPMMAYAQEEAVVSGRVTDSSGGVLPGVTVRAVHEVTGNAFEAVTDQLGAYRIAVRVGTVRVTAELQGFNAMARAVELLLGQTAVVNLQMSPAGVTETLTVDRRGALDRDHHVDAGGQRRSAAGGGAPDVRAQLAGTCNAGPGEPVAPRRELERKLRESTAGQK